MGLGDLLGPVTLLAVLSLFSRAPAAVGQEGPSDREGELNEFFFRSGASICSKHTARNSSSVILTQIFSS